jgi:signal transduction histidine kinase/DNA-binding response OmpR family regulator
VIQLKYLPNEKKHVGLIVTTLTMKTINIIFVLLLTNAIVCNTVSAQNPWRDSLIQVIENHPADTARINAILELTEHFTDSIDFIWIDLGEGLINKAATKESNVYYREAGVRLCMNRGYYYFANDIDYERALDITSNCLKMAHSVGNNQLIGHAYNNMASFEFSMGRSEDCLNHMNEALRYRKLHGNEAEIAQTTANLGFILFKSGLLQQSLEYLYQAMAMSDSLQDINLKGTTLHYLGQVFDQQQDYDRMLSTARELLVIHRQFNDPKRLSSGFNNIGRAYDKLNQNDSAMVYYRQSLELREQIGYEYGIANSHNNIGYLLYKQGELEDALPHYIQAYNIWGEISNYESMASVCVNIGKLYQDRQQPDSAIYYGTRALEIATEQNSLPDMKNASLLLAEVYEHKGNPTQALFHFKNYQQFAEQVHNQQNTRELEQRVLGYEFNQREAALKAEQAQKEIKSALELQNQKNVRNISFGLVFLALMFLWVILNRYRIKQKAAKALEEKNIQIEAAKERAEKSEAFRKQFLANMSHEIRTPMNAIIGMSRLLLDQPIDALSKSYAEAINHSGENLLVVLNDVLDLSKLEAGKMQLSPTSFNLRNELNLLVAAYSQRVQEKGLKLMLTIDDDLQTYIIGDVARINQILNNLLNNAIKFTNRGTVRLKVRKKNSNILFEVIDSGIGIPDAELKNIFSSFAQVKNDKSTETGGTGLGLTIASQLLQLMGSELKVTSTLNSGSNFYFEVELPSAEAPTQSEAQLKTISAFDAAGITILLAEDNEYNTLVTRGTLKKYFPGVEIIEVINGTQALEQATNKLFNLVLMDIQMPGMDGYACTMAIRKLANRTHADVPIIALTASVVQSDLTRCLESGMNDYIPKPFSEPEFVQKISTILKLNATIYTQLSESNSTLSVEEIELFLKLVPKRLKKLETAFKNADWQTVKKLVHLMRPQLLHSGLDKHRDFLESFDQLDGSTPFRIWHDRISTFTNLVKAKINELDPNIQ